ncbi:peptidyl-prolyl cis-trans isomerase [Pseudobutyrivibrio xylanivorans]|uniref:Uncharacterized protein n=1 Tax=Pseudobutyrivibrio xylanivorans TaxID=185007 RepID=A0A5P6VQY2_PSEXY|nr:peptidyl-prolyl cis-trans isomerase [Pseudobutyrivibrio xylanivorans]QFJ55026.1 hypothetical protein FXF36_09200 [Pseudobutyrivibrio xylanivorans]
MKNAKLRAAGLAALSAAVIFTGCGKVNPNETLVKIKNGDASETISLGYANFAARYQQSMYDQYLLSYYGEGMWQSDMTGSGSTLEQETKDEVLNQLEEYYLAKAHASDYSISLTDEQTKAIEEAAAKFMTDNSQETLDQMGATEAIVKQYLEDRTYYSLVSAAAKEAAGADIKDDDCWMRSFTYVLFDTNGKKDDDGNLVEYTDEELTNLKAQAKSLSTSEDFDGDVEKLGLSTSSYSYLKGETEDSTMDMSIINAAEALKEGEISSVIQVDGAGYYVLRLDKDHDTDASDNKKESLESDAFNTLMDSWKEAITWTVDEKVWEKVKFDSLFKAVEKEEASEETESTTEETESTEESAEDSDQD